MSSQESPKKENFSVIDFQADFTKLPNSLKEIEACYKELPLAALNDNFFMACFWKSFGVDDLADSVLKDYNSEFKAVKEYNEKVVNAKKNE